MGLDFSLIWPESTNCYYQGLYFIQNCFLHISSITDLAFGSCSQCAMPFCTWSKYKELGIHEGIENYSQRTYVTSIGAGRDLRWSLWRVSGNKNWYPQLDAPSFFSASTRRSSIFDPSGKGSVHFTSLVAARAFLYSALGFLAVKENRRSFAFRRSCIAAPAAALVSLLSRVTILYSELSPVCSILFYFFILAYFLHVTTQRMVLRPRQLATDRDCARKRIYQR
jgi:hypothetical protein